MMHLCICNTEYLIYRIKNNNNSVVKLSLQIAETLLNDYFNNRKGFKFTLLSVQALHIKLN